MGQTKSTNAPTANWSVDDWAFGTGANALSAEEVMAETSKLPAKLFGGEVIQNDPSMNQMQTDLLSIDETFKNLFRSKKKKQKKSAATSQTTYQEQGQYHHHESQQGHGDYLQPISVDKNASAPSAPLYPQSAQRLTWRCTGCTSENKVSERFCRRCGQAETTF